MKTRTAEELVKHLQTWHASSYPALAASAIAIDALATLARAWAAYDKLAGDPKREDSPQWYAVRDAARVVDTLGLLKGPPHA